MGELVVNGGRRLFGTVRIHGAKNSVLPILSATILNRGESIIHNCPKLKDVDAAVEILRYLGCLVTREGSTLIIDSSTMDCCEVPDSLMREMRSSVIFLGAVIARAGRCRMSFPGGCELGPRPIDIHLSAFRELGISIVEDSGILDCNVAGMHGRNLNLSVPSVGATENIMLAATACTGITRIINAAREPEIEDLQRFVNAMGGKVRGAGGSVVEIEGVLPNLRPEYTVMPDRIVTATFLCAAAGTGGSIRVEGAVPLHVSTLTAALAEAGCKIEVTADTISIGAQGTLHSIGPVRTMPYPGFPTDAQAQLLTVMTRAEGSTVFIENIFENRYRQVGELTRMGADIKVTGKVAVVCGPRRLSGTQVCATDLRGGAALVIAGLMAEGQTVIHGINHIDRGYEGFENNLADLGAGIVRVE